MKKTLIILTGLFIIGCSHLTKEERAEKNCHDEALAFQMTESFVKNRLKSPSTAKFASIINDNVSMKNTEGCTHVVKSFVDSQNGFGATVRNKYVAVLTYSKETNRWTLNKINIR